MRQVLGIPAGAAIATAVVAASHSAPVVTTWGQVRNRVLPRLAGVGARDGVALTFDDGPDPVSTPAFLDALDALGVRATFFLLGTLVARAPSLTAEITAAGHEVAVHGWDHRSMLLRLPPAALDGLRRARDVITAASGATPTMYRPPFGQLSVSALAGARGAGLQTVLWTVWGADWVASATPESVLHELGEPRGGATILLHDSDCTSTPGSWRTTLAALPRVVEQCAAAGLAVRPLGEHLHQAMMPPVPPPLPATVGPPAPSVIP